MERWVRARGDASYMCAISRAEIEYGIALLPSGKRKTQLAESAAAMLAVFAGRCLPFDSEDCPHYAAIRADDRKGGRPLGNDRMMADAMIAAVAHRHSLTLATRNTKHFPKRMDIVDPWR